jgi:hypothetical protein
MSPNDERNLKPNLFNLIQLFFSAADFAFVAELNYFFGLQDTPDFHGDDGGDAGTFQIYENLDLDHITENGIKIRTFTLGSNLARTLSQVVEFGAAIIVISDLPGDDTYFAKVQSLGPEPLRSFS